MMKYTGIYALFLVFIFCNYCEGQNKTDLPTGNAKSQTEGTTTLHGPGTRFVPSGRIEKAISGLRQMKVLSGTMENLLPISQAK